jgi:hypothetical protein
VSKARAAALKSKHLIEGDIRMADPKKNVPVWTSEESFEDETWSPEIAEERARMVQGNAPESPTPGTPRGPSNDPDLARPVTPAQGGVTAEKMMAEPPGGKKLLGREAQERAGSGDPATPIYPASGGGDPPKLKTEGVTSASFERYATVTSEPREQDATSQEVTRSEVATEDEKPRRGRPPKANAKTENE